MDMTPRRSPPHPPSTASLRRRPWATLAEALAVLGATIALDARRQPRPDGRECCTSRRLVAGGRRSPLEPRIGIDRRAVNRSVAAGRRCTKAGLDAEILELTEEASDRAPRLAAAPDQSRRDAARGQLLGRGPGGSRFPARNLHASAPELDLERAGYRAAVCSMLGLALQVGLFCDRRRPADDPLAGRRLPRGRVRRAALLGSIRLGGWPAAAGRSGRRCRLWGGCSSCLGLPVREQADPREQLLADPVTSCCRLAPWIVIAAPLAEEVFFRGYLFRFVGQGAGRPAGYLASSLLFRADPPESVRDSSVYLRGRQPVRLGLRSQRAVAVADPGPRRLQRDAAWSYLAAG